MDKGSRTHVQLTGTLVAVVLKVTIRCNRAVLIHTLEVLSVLDQLVNSSLCVCRNFDVLRPLLQRSLVIVLLLQLPLLQLFLQLSDALCILLGVKALELRLNLLFRHVGNARVAGLLTLLLRLSHSLSELLHRLNALLAQQVLLGLSQHHTTNLGTNKLLNERIDFNVCGVSGLSLLELLVQFLEESGVSLLSNLLVSLRLE